MTVAYDPGNVDHFIALADAIEERFPDLIVEGLEVDTHGSAGRMFEVKSAEGHFLFSGRQQGRLPEAAELLSALEQAGVSGA